MQKYGIAKYKHLIKLFRLLYCQVVVFFNFASIININMRSFFPNLITLLNLLSGIFSILFSFYGHLDWAGYFIFLAVFFDFFDGFVARLLKVSSDIGKELDSLSDLVSFGVAPAFLIFFVLVKVNEINFSLALPSTILLLLFVPFIMPLFGAYRLARFNVQHSKHSGFIGMPIPANAIFHAGIGILFSMLVGCEPFSPFVLTILIDINLLLFCFLMVSNIKMIAFKNMSRDLSSVFFQYLLIFFALIMLATAGLFAIPLIIYFYILLSIGKNLFFNKE